MAAADWATIFSRNNAPPPPLMSWKSVSNSSAPSMTTSSPANSPNSASGIPTSCASFSVAILVGTPIISSPSSAILRPSSITVKATVEPVPRPTFIPLETTSQAAIPAARLSASAVCILIPPARPGRPTSIGITTPADGCFRKLLRGRLC